MLTKDILEQLEEAISRQNAHIAEVLNEWGDDTDVSIEISIADALKFAFNHITTLEAKAKSAREMANLLMGTKAFLIGESILHESNDLFKKFDKTLKRYEKL